MLFRNLQQSSGRNETLLTPADPDNSVIEPYLWAALNVYG